MVADLAEYAHALTKVHAHPIYQELMSFDSSFHSPLLPTSRWGMPAYALFSANQAILFDDFSPPGLPDRWLAFDARHLRPLAFGLTAVVSFTAHELLQAPDVVPPPMTMEVARANLTEQISLLGQLAPLFFTHGAAGHDQRSRLLDLLTVSVPTGVVAWEAELTPDFFAWLAA
jgi:hypothetical protein